MPLLVALEARFLGDKAINGEMLVHELVVLFVPEHRHVLGDMGPLSGDPFSESLVVSIYSRKPIFLSIDCNQPLVGHKECMLLWVVMKPCREELIPAF